MSATETTLKGLLRNIATVRNALQTTQPHAISTGFVFAEIGSAAAKLRKIERELEALIQDLGALE